MYARSIQIGGLLALSIFGFAQAAKADDDTPKTTAPSDSTASTPTKPSTSTTPSTGSQTYITVGNVKGEIVKVDSKQITLRVLKPKAPPPGPENAANRKQYEHELHVQEQLARYEAKNNKNPEYTDYIMDFAVDAQARIQHLPIKHDENGKKVAYTADELKNLKGNPEIPGWKAKLSALKVGETVEAHIVVLPAAAKEGFKKDDLIVRWALVLKGPPKRVDGTTPAP